MSRDKGSRGFGCLTPNYPPPGGVEKKKNKRFCFVCVVGVVWVIYVVTVPERHTSSHQVE